MGERWKPLSSQQEPDAKRMGCKNPTTVPAITPRTGTGTTACPRTCNPCTPFAFPRSYSVLTCSCSFSFDATISLPTLHRHIHGEQPGTRGKDGRMHMRYGRELWRHAHRDGYADSTPACLPWPSHTSCARTDVPVVRQLLGRAVLVHQLRAPHTRLRHHRSRHVIHACTMSRQGGARGFRMIIMLPCKTKRATQ